MDYIHYNSSGPNIEDFQRAMEDYANTDRDEIDIRRIEPVQSYSVISTEEMNLLTTHRGIRCYNQENSTSYVHDGVDWIAQVENLGHPSVNQGILAPIEGLDNNVTTLRGTNKPILYGTAGGEEIKEDVEFLGNIER